jgi:hypothetical protein
LVAAGTFEDARIPPLPMAADDALRLQQVLEDPHIGAYDVEVLVDRPLAEVRRAIERFYAGATAADVLLLYFSGHGRREAGGGLSFPVLDTEMDWFQSSSLDASFVNNQIQRSEGRGNVVLLDCCYAGAFRAGAGQLSLEAHFEGDGLAVLSASRSVEEAWAQGGDRPGSLFTMAVVEGLATGAADRFTTGSVTVHDLSAYVHDRVVELSGGVQQPGKFENIVGELVVANSVRNKVLPEGEPGAVAPPPSIDDVVLRLVRGDYGAVVKSMVSGGLPPVAATTIADEATRRLERAQRMAADRLYPGVDAADVVRELVVQGFDEAAANAIVDRAWEQRPLDEPPAHVEGEVRLDRQKVHLRTSDSGIELGALVLRWSEVDGFAVGGLSTVRNLVTITAGDRRALIGLPTGLLAEGATATESRTLRAYLPSLFMHFAGRRIVGQSVDAVERGGAVSVGPLSVNMSGLMMKGRLGKPKFLTWDAFAGTSNLGTGVAVRRGTTDGKSATWALVGWQVRNVLLVPDLLREVSARASAGHGP